MKKIVGQSRCTQNS